MIPSSPLRCDESEISVLGGMMLEETAADRGMELLKEDDFYHPAHRRIFAAIGALRDQGHTPDALSVREELRRHSSLDEAGGVEYLARIVETVPTAVNLPYHARTMLEFSDRRAIYDLGQWAIRSAPNGDALEDLKDEAERRVFRITDRSSTRDGKPIGDLIESSLATGRRMPEVAIRTSLSDLDQLTGGLRPGEETTIGALPSRGKTALGVQIGYEGAKQGRDVAYISLEMSEWQLVLRFVACSAGIDLRRLLGAEPLDRREREAVEAAKGLLAKLPITIATLPRRIGEIRSFARRQAKNGLDLLIVDYVQLAQGEARSENRTQEIGSISRGLKRLAIEAEIAVVGLAQLSRAAERHGGSGRPRLSDLRESGDLEADADAVWLIHRPDFELTENEARNLGVLNKAELIVAKNRNGPTGIVTLHFNRPSATFGLWEGRRG